MPLGEYSCNKQFTEDQRQMDADYGIFESQTRSLVFNQGNTFKFTYHYYYQHERGYQLVKQIGYDTSFSGTFAEQGQNVVLTVLNGEHNGGDKLSNKLESFNNITGTITFGIDGNCLKVTSVKFGKQFTSRSVVTQNMVFKKKP